jgi:predicted MPP superfamily phosphohydrolase
LRRRRGRWLAILLLAGYAVFAWARLVEPHWVRVQRTTLVGTGAQARLALISDLHLGIYKRRDDLRRVVDRINALQVDAVLIAGDLTYEPAGRALAPLFTPLSDLRAPVFAVLGNHDQQRPGPDIDTELRAALALHGVTVIEGPR